MVDVEIQLRGNKEIYFLGDIIAGDVLLTTAKPAEILQIEIKLKGIAHLHLHSEKGTDRHNIQNFEPHEASLPPELNHGDSTCSSPGLVSKPPVIRIESSESRHDIVFYRRNKYLIVSSSTWLKSGVNLFSFEAELPSDTECSLPSFSSSSRIIHIEYFVEAVVSVPFPLWKSFSFGKRHKKPFQVVQRTLACDMELNSQSNFAESNILVGFWTKKSSSFGSLIKYAFGADTAEHWQEYSVRVKLPKLLSVLEKPYYLQDQLKIEVRSIGKRPSSVVVDAISLRVNSSYIYKISSKYITTPILNYKEPWPTHIEKFRDITFLISGAKLPQHLAPSINRIGISINHKFIIMIALKCIGEDGTKQSPAKIEMSLPLMLSCSRLLLKEV